MQSVSIIFPHQLFESNPCLHPDRKVFLVEEFLYFKQYHFHTQKLVFHRASMKFYQDFLKDHGYTVEYIEANNESADVRELIPRLSKMGVKEIHYVDVVDDWLGKRIALAIEHQGMRSIQYDSPMFLNRMEELRDYFDKRKRFFHSDFYIHQRNKLGILMHKDGKPVGGKWSFDAENRLKYPKDKKVPSIQFPPKNKYHNEALAYVEKHFHRTDISYQQPLFYPVSYKSSREWLWQFFQNRFMEFGKYEDAIMADEHILHHSLLSPLLNTGLITPEEVIDQALRFAHENDVPMNSLEGFIRQIIGWREFIRAIYELKGQEERTMNFWGFTRKMPAAFWSGTTGITPLDLVIKKVLKTGYAHHIERLMVLGNFMLLCEFDPDEVYRWFMEMFVDAYDWVMVPNVYGMSQFADGGLLATKPYISSSNYLMKMSDFKKDDWQEVWDALFWRFMHQYRNVFLSNPRLAMLIRTFDKMKTEKKVALLSKASKYLDNIN